MASTPAGRPTATAIGSVSHSRLSRQCRRRSSRGGPEELVSRCKRIMGDFEESRFEHEGTARASLRSGLCLEGNGWALSDQEAAGIVHDVLRSMGAVKPTWAEGQPDYVEMGHRCLVCRGRLPEILLSGLFCSEACGSAYRKRADFARRTRSDQHYWRISDALAMVRNPPKQCGHCSKPFRTKDRNQVYCSASCRTAASNAAMRQDLVGRCARECCGTNLPRLPIGRPTVRRCSHIMAGRAYRARKRLEAAEINGRS